MIVLEWIFGWIPVWIWAVIALVVLSGGVIYLRAIGVPLATAIGAALAAGGSILAVGAMLRGRAAGRQDEQERLREAARQREDARRAKTDEIENLDDAATRQRLDKWVRPSD